MVFDGDGNGNVSGLIDAANGSVIARYEYGPFGELLRATGPMARVNPVRFSTNYQDDETDLVYYGHRYLGTSLGGWVSRDPVAEAGGLPLYAFAANAGPAKVDVLGMTSFRFWNKSYTNGGFIWTEEEVPPPPNRQEGLRGLTTRAKWDVRFWTVPPGVATKPTEPSSCCWRLEGAGQGGAVFWSMDAPGDRRGTYGHELVHLQLHYNAWDALVGALQSFLDTCLSYKQLKCYRRVAPRLVNAYGGLGRLDNARFDAGDPIYDPAPRAEKQKWVDENEDRIQSELDSALKAAGACSQN